MGRRNNTSLSWPVIRSNPIRRSDSTEAFPFLAGAVRSTQFQPFQEAASEARRQVEGPCIKGDPRIRLKLAHGKQVCSICHRTGLATELHCRNTAARGMPDSTEVLQTIATPAVKMYIPSTNVRANVSTKMSVSTSKMWKNVSMTQMMQNALNFPQESGYNEFHDDSAQSNRRTLRRLSCRGPDAVEVRSNMQQTTSDAVMYSIPLLGSPLLGPVTKVTNQKQTRKGQRRMQKCQDSLTCQGRPNAEMTEFHGFPLLGIPLLGSVTNVTRLKCTRTRTKRHRPHRRAHKLRSAAHPFLPQHRPAIHRSAAIVKAAGKKRRGLCTKGRLHPRRIQQVTAGNQSSADAEQVLEARDEKNFMMGGIPMTQWQLLAEPRSDEDLAAMIQRHRLHGADQQPLGGESMTGKALWKAIVANPTRPRNLRLSSLRVAAQKVDILMSNMWADKTMYDRRCLFTRLLTWCKKNDLQLNQETALLYVMSCPEADFSSQLPYVSQISAVFGHLGQPRQQLLSIMPPLRRMGAKIPETQAVPIAKEHVLRLIQVWPSLQKDAVRLSILLLWKTCSRIDDIRWLTRKNFIKITQEEVIIDWWNLCKGRETNPYHPSRYTVIVGDWTDIIADIAMTTSETVPFSPFDESIFNATTINLEQPLNEYTGHSFKRGGFAHIVKFAPADQYSQTQLSILMKHTVVCDLAKISLRYDSSAPGQEGDEISCHTARMLGTQNVTRFL